MKTIKEKIHWAVILLLFASNLGHAQTWSQDQNGKVATLQLVPPEKVPRFGTFWLLQRKTAPLPINRFPELPVYYLGHGNSFLVDDSSVDWAAIYKQREADRALRRLEWEDGLLSDAEYWAFEGGEPGPMAYSYGPEELWLEVTGVTNPYVYLTLHGTVDTDWYQLMGRTNLLQPGEWTLSDPLSVPRLGDPGTNQTVFPPVDMGDNTNMFFRAHHALQYVTIGNGPYAYEPSAVLPLGQNGAFYVSATLANQDLTVYYRVSGTASNGVDYTNLTGMVTIPANESQSTIEVYPIADSFAEGSETITLTLLQTNNYLIHPGYTNATILIKDLSTTVQVAFGGNAIEPDGPPGAAAQSGAFQFSRFDDLSAYPPLTVIYSLSGIAGNGVDYTNLTGTFTFADQAQFPTLNIDPKADTFLEGSETVTLTLLPTNTYLIVPGYDSATISMDDSSTLVSVVAVTNTTPEPISATSTSNPAVFAISRSDARNPGAFPALTVAYQLSGSASNGGDFSYLSGTVTFQTNETVTNVLVQAAYDDRFEGDESVKLTLTPIGDGYLIDTNSSSATVLILDNQTNLFRLVVTNFSAPCGIDYHQPTNSLIVSGFYLGGQFNFARIYTNTVSSNIVTVVTNWSGINTVGDELKLVTVKTTANGFTNGDTYFSSATGIGWLSADGTRSNLNWCVLTNSFETNSLPIRGGLCFDTTGIFSNQLIVVTSPGTGTPGLKGVWRVGSNGTNGVPTLITHIDTPHLEGVIVLTNDVSKWGPWAGKIVTGDETKNPPLIYTIDVAGAVIQYDTTTIAADGIRTEDFDIIPQYQDLYACDQARSAIAKLSWNYLTNFVGDLLITDELSVPRKCFIVRWDAATTNFTARSIPFKYSDNASGQFEHVTFAPLDLPPLTP